MLADSEENAYYLEWSNREGVNSRTIATVMHRDKDAHDVRYNHSFLFNIKLSSLCF